jgi:hypothetical protein
MNHFVFSAVVVFFSTLVSGVYFFYKTSRAERVFGFFWLATAFWTLTVGFQHEWLSFLPDQIWGWFLHVGCISVPIVFFNFSVEYAASIEKKPDVRAKAFVVIGYLIAFAFVLLNTFTPWFTHTTVHNALYAYPKPAVLYPIYILFFQVFGIWATLILFRLRKAVPPAARKLLFIYLIVHLLAYAGSMDNYLIMYEIRIFPLYPYGLYLVAPYAVIGSLMIARINKIRQGV